MKKIDKKYLERVIYTIKENNNFNITDEDKQYEIKNILEDLLLVSQSVDTVNELYEHIIPLCNKENLKLAHSILSAIKITVEEFEKQKKEKNLEKYLKGLDSLSLYNLKRILGYNFTEKDLTEQSYRYENPELYFSENSSSFLVVYSEEEKRIISLIDNINEERDKKVAEAKGYSSVEEFEYNMELNLLKQTVSHTEKRRKEIYIKNKFSKFFLDNQK